MTPKQGLPEYECEWCGRPVKYVRLMNGHDYHPEKYTVQLIDAEALPGNAGEVAALHPRYANGRTDCAYRILPESGVKWSYMLHRSTCPDRHKWTGVRKWKQTIRDRDTLIPGPELDAARARAAAMGVPFVS